MTSTVSFNSIVSLLSSLTNEEQVLLVNHAKEFNEFVSDLRHSDDISTAAEEYIPEKILVRLTEREKKLLVCLLTNYNCERIVPVNWRDLYLAVYERAVDQEASCPNRLRVLIAMTRKKIVHWAFIRSQPKVGNWLVLRERLCCRPCKLAEVLRLNV